MAQIIPAILTDDKEQFKNQIAIVKKISRRFQLDVIDGQFVNNRTLAPQEIKKPAGMLIDLHLMVVDPGKFIQQSISLKPNLIIIQYEIQKNITPYLQRIKDLKIHCGLAINPQTPIDEIGSLLKLIDHLLIMAYPAGFAGQKFQSANLSKALQARKIKPDLEIGLDGGVSLSNIKLIAKANFDIINVNSAIFKAKNPVRAYQRLTEAIL